MSVRQVAVQPSFYLLVAAFALVFLAAPALHLHMIPYLTDAGLGPGVAVVVVAVVAAGGAVGSVLSGFLAERFGARAVMTCDMLLIASAFLLLGGVHTPGQALAWGVYYGVASGGMFTLQQIVFADYYGRESLGAIRGVVWPVQMVANATGPLAAAIAYDATGSYAQIFTIFAGLVLASSVLVFLARPPFRGDLPAAGPPGAGVPEAQAGPARR